MNFQILITSSDYSIIIHVGYLIILKTLNMVYDRKILKTRKNMNSLKLITVCITSILMLITGKSIVINLFWWPTLPVTGKKEITGEHWSKLNGSPKEDAYGGRHVVSSSASCIPSHFPFLVLWRVCALNQSPEVCFWL